MIRWPQWLVGNNLHKGDHGLSEDNILAFAWSKYYGSSNSNWVGREDKTSKPM